MSTCIYTVTVFDVRRKDPLGSSRTWGWFPTKEEAEADFRADMGLYFESGTYQIALIEEVPPGMLGGLTTRKTWWFRADYCEDQPYMITSLTVPPEFARDVVCFSMG